MSEHPDRPQTPPGPSADEDAGIVLTTPASGGTDLAALERTLPARKNASGSAPVLPSTLRRGEGGLERYRLIEEVGQGGMAVVYRAHDTALDREVAVKVLHPHLAGQAESRDRLEREAQAVAKLRHENILEIFDYSGRGSDKSFIVTEFIHGTTLRAFMQAHPLPYPELAEMIIFEIARALEHAHKAGIIHRDIKPENVMIRRDGVVKLTDFGIAQMIDRERMTVTGQLLGSPAYMAPEHVEGGGIDFRTDVFALGILLYQLATGQLPFRGKNPHEVLKRIADCVYAPPDTVSPRVGRRLTAVIARALAKDKDARFAEVGMMRGELAEDLADAGIVDPRAELARLFVSPEAYCAELGPRLADALTLRGRALAQAGRRGAALELWRRALEITPRSGALLALIAGVERRRRVGQVAAGVLGAALLLGGAGVAVQGLRARYLAPALPVRTTPIAIPPPVAPIARTTPRPTTPLTPVEDPPTSRPRIDRTRMVAVVPPTHRPAIKRRFELVPTPKAVRVLLDGNMLGDYGPQLQSVEVDDGPHTITFESAHCYPEVIAIDADTEPGRIARRLKWRPATITVRAEPADSDVLIDGKLIGRSGHPIPLPMDPLSNGSRTIRVKVSAPSHLSDERELTLRANDAQTVDVTLRQMGPP